MRLDQLLATLGIIKRRTEAKRMADNGLISVNQRPAKPSQSISTGDIIAIGGSKPLSVEIIKVPGASVRKDQRDEYFRTLS
jgi:ribosomal 50S subunit-recycling heat shock protein